MALINWKALSNCLDAALLRRSAMVALVVGTALVAINQGDVILAGGVPKLWKVALTYVVPFLVATYGAYSALCVEQDADQADEHSS